MAEWRILEIMLSIAKRSPWKNIFTRRKQPLLLLAMTLLVGMSALVAQTPDGLRSDAILDHLNAVIDWHRNTLTRVPTVGVPSDAVYQFNAQNMATEVVQLAFQSAQAEAPLLPATSPASVPGAGTTTSQQSLAKMQSDVKTRISALEAQISDLNLQIAKAPKSTRQQLTVQRESAQGELDLRKATSEAFDQMAQFVSNNGEGGKGGLEGSINELRRSVPELSNTGAKSAAKPPAAGVSMPSNGGLIGEVIGLYDQLQAMHQLTQMMQQTAAVRDAANKLRSPLVATLRATIQQGEQLANQTNSASTPAAQPDQQRKQFDVLTARFKQIAGASVPLREETILLDQSGSNFQEWRQSVVHESNRILRSIVLRVLGIALAMGLILLLSELWRRITFRYISDVRRRRQFLVLRRIVIGFCMGLVLILGFVSEFSSLATFAGFITAGLAVGLQTILLSVAAYFFLVGRWGIRVGDRISVAGVTGDVVDVGLVRLYLMELAGTGIDLYQTGRIVVFSNSVLFQPTTPLFKQLPGADYAWHEVVVPLNPAGKFNLVETQLLEAVNSVISGYSTELQRLLGTTERRIDIPLKMPEPHGQLRYGDSGLEYVVRYPVGLHQVSEVDEKVTRKLLELLQQQPELQSSISGYPKIRAAIKG
jgi:small-conductance mechanosensitive channel/DNA-binding FrmR family transcriptional regulator